MFEVSSKKSEDTKNKKRKMIYAGIVLFNPSLKRLNENIKAIINQVDKVVLVDNKSKNINEIKELLKSFDKCKLMCNSSNMGISEALNELVFYSGKDTAEYLLTLDQDSVASVNMVKELYRFAGEDIAITCPYIVDRNKMSIKDFKALSLPDTNNILYAITSGSLINIHICKKLGGFDTNLFIDMVDFDYSKRVLINGYKQFRVNTTYLLHEIGKAEPTFIIRPYRDNAGVWFLKRLYRTNHSLQRQYFMARNEMIVARKYKKYINPYKSAFKGFFVSMARILVEKHKFKVMISIIRGLYDGLTCKIDVYLKESSK